MIKYKIQKGVPLPERVQQASRWKGALNKMEVGDMVNVPGPASATQLRQAMYRHEPRMRGTCARQENGTVNVWRIE